MDFKPLRLGVTFCDTRFLVAVSPLSTIADLKEEITRVYRLIDAPEKLSKSEDEAVYIQDGRGYLVSDDYQVGLVLDHVDTVFALTKSQSFDKYSVQWSMLSGLATPQSSRSSVPASSNISTAVQIGSPVVKSPLSHASIGSVSKTSKVIESATAVTRKYEDESYTSETDCSANLIPELLEDNLSVPLDVKDKASAQVKGGDTATVATTAQTKPNGNSASNSDSTKKSDTLPPANSSKKKTTQIVYSDSSGLTSSDSDPDVVAVVPATRKGRSEGKPSKVSTEQQKAASKKKSTKKQTQGQNATSTPEPAPSDKTRVSDSDEATGKADKRPLQTFQLATDDVESQATTSRKMKAKRKLDKALSANPEKKSKKKYTSAISKKELDLANTSTQSLILDNEELWTE